MAEIPIGSFILYMLPEHVMPRDDKKLMLLLVKAIQATTGSVTSPVIQKRIDWTTIVDTSDGNIVWNRQSILPEEPYPAPFAVRDGERSDGWRNNLYLTLVEKGKTKRKA
jgi:hypothetical protein